MIVVAALAAAGVQPAAAAAGDITTVAGDGGYPDYWRGSDNGDGGPATSAQLGSPYGVAMAPDKFFVSESGWRYPDSRVRAVDGSGIIDTFAGGVAPPLNDGAVATEAALAYAHDVTHDTVGNLYIADTVHHRVRKVDAATRVITTVAGRTVCDDITFCRGGFSGDGGPATDAELNFPDAVAVDRDGNLYIADSSNRRVRKVDVGTGIISTVAGGGTPADGLGDDGPATEAVLSYPRSVALDSAGDLLIADTYVQRVRKVDTATGIITTVAGKGTVGFSGDGGPAQEAEFRYIYDVAVGPDGSLLIADGYNHRVRKVDPSGIVTTVAGSGLDGFRGGGFSGDGGPATDAQFYIVYRVAPDPVGNLYISDLGNRRVRKVDPSGIISTFAGNGEWGFGGDGGPATDARLYPEGLSIEGADVFIADSQSSRIRKVDTAGIITTVAGGGVGDGFPANQAALRGPRGLAKDGAGNLLIADCGNNRVREVDASGIISTVAGSASPRGLGDGGPATSAALTCPTGLFAASNGALYIADAEDHRVRRVDPGGTITTVAGTGAYGYGGDGGSATSAQLASPSGVALDGAGNLYIADKDNHRVRRVDPAGMITTVAGTGGSGFGGDGVAATSTPVTWPTGVAVDPSGQLAIAESGFARIRKVDLSGMITTIAGNGISGFSGDGGPATSATLNGPTQLVQDEGGNVLFTDRGNRRVRRVEAGSPPPPPIATRKTADCGKVVVKNMTLSDDIGPCAGDGLIIGADNVKLNLNGHKIIGDGNRSGEDVGVRLAGRKNVTVTKGTVSGFDAGVAIIGGSKNTVSELRLADNVGSEDTWNSTFGDGVVVFYSPSNSIRNNLVLNSGLFDGIGVLGAGSDNNVIQGNKVVGTTNGGNDWAPGTGIGIVVNPFLGLDRPREQSLYGNQLIGNKVLDNGSAGISMLSNIDGVVRDNVVERNGFESEWGVAFPGNGIGVRNLFFAEPRTRVLVEGNQVNGNANNGIEVASQENQISGNRATGNGGEYGGVWAFDLVDYNWDPETYEANCDSNVWSENIWGSGGFYPDCTSTGGHAISPNDSKPAPQAQDPNAEDPTPRKAPAKP